MAQWLSILIMLLPSACLLVPAGAAYVIIASAYRPVQYASVASDAWMCCVIMQQLQACMALLEYAQSQKCLYTQ